MIDKSTLRACRDRNGEPADSRPDWVDSLFSPKEILGYHEGKPLAADSYDSYPESGEELLNPSSRGFLENVFRHRLVESFEDAAKEVPNGSASQMENLSDLHEIDAESLFEEGEAIVETDDTPDDHIQVGEDEYVPLDWFRSVPWESGHLLYALLGEAGMSVSEAATFIGDAMDDHPIPDESDIRNAAAACGLLADSNPHIDYLTKKAEEARQRRHNQLVEDQRRQLYGDSQSSDSDDDDSGESAPSVSSHSY